MPPSGRMVSPSSARQQQPQQRQQKPTEKTVEKPKLSKRTQAVVELIDYATIPLMGKAATEQIKLKDNEISPWALDFHIVQANKLPFAEAINQLADQYPVIGMMLDKLGGVGPVASIATIAITVGLQIAENHDKLPAQVASMMPITPREEFAQMVSEEINSHQSGNGQSATA